MTLPISLARGDRVQLIGLPAYIKTADPMPTLRSPKVLTLGEIGTVLDRRPGGYWAIRFAAGAYLIEPQYLQNLQKQTEPEPG
jgi:hypothetical protein